MYPPPHADECKLPEVHLPRKDVSQMLKYLLKKQEMNAPDRNLIPNRRISTLFTAPSLAIQSQAPPPIVPSLSLGATQLTVQTEGFGSRSRFTGPWMRGFLSLF